MTLAGAIKYAGHQAYSPWNDRLAAFMDPDLTKDQYVDLFEASLDMNNRAMPVAPQEVKQKTDTERAVNKYVYDCRMYGIPIPEIAELSGRSYHNAIRTLKIIVESVPELSRRQQCAKYWGPPSRARLNKCATGVYVDVATGIVNGLSHTEICKKLGIGMTALNSRCDRLYAQVCKIGGRRGDLGLIAWVCGGITTEDYPARPKVLCAQDVTEDE